MKRRKFLQLLGLTGAGVLISSYPLFIERQWLQVNHYTVPTPGLPPAFHGFTIAQVTDIHLGLLVSAAFVEGVVQTTNALAPDLIACTGDYVHQRNTRKEIDRVWPILTGLKARHGVFSVLGNHDHWADSERSLYWLERSGQNLRHRHRTIERDGTRLIFAGAGDFWEDQLGIDAAFAGSESDPGACRILLSHNPDSLDTPFTTQVSLVLSGHTHGGQVVIPGFGPPVLPVSNKRYSSGLIVTDRSQVFISRGIGWAIIPVRFNCYPEIAVLKLVPAPATFATKDLCSDSVIALGLAGR